MSDYPPRRDPADKAEEGDMITKTEVSQLSKKETEIGGGPVKGGPAATAQGLHQKQENFRDKAADVMYKDSSNVTKEDAAELQKREARAQDGIPPGKGSVASKVQSLADQNAKNE